MPFSFEASTVIRIFVDQLSAVLLVVDAEPLVVNVSVHLDVRTADCGTEWSKQNMCCFFLLLNGELSFGKNVRI